MVTVRGVSRKLGELLIREEMITREELDEALKKKSNSNRFLGEILVEMDCITEEELIGFLVRQCRIPHLKLSNFQISSDIAELIPAEICEEHKLIPIDKLGNLLTIAMVNPIDVEALEKIKDTVDFRIKPILCSWADFRALFEKLYGGEDERKIRRGHDTIPELIDEDIKGLPAAASSSRTKKKDEPPAPSAVEPDEEARGNEADEAKTPSAAIAAWPWCRRPVPCPA